MVKTLPSSAGGMDSVPAWGTKISHTKNQNVNNRSSILTNSIKTFKMVHIKKILKKEYTMVTKITNTVLYDGNLLLNESKMYLLSHTQTQTQTHTHTQKISM